MQSRRRERSCSLLLDAAYPLFVAQGYSATSMRQVAERAGLALGGIYNHFACKEAIFQTILLERHPYQRIMRLLKKMQVDPFGNVDRKTARGLMNELSRHPKFFN